VSASAGIEGKIIVLTGASSGIGAAAARQLTADGAIVVPVGRSPQKTAALASSIGVEPLIADFAVLDDVRRLADSILQRCPTIDVLVHNAGGTVGHRTMTVDGHELTFQTNHLAPFLLQALLHERVVATPGSRIVVTSSAANRLGHVRLDDLDNRRHHYISFRAYATAKLENILFTKELGRRLAGTTTTAVSFHPGVVATDFARDSALLGALYRSIVGQRAMIPAEAGAAALMSLAERDDIASFQGDYFDRFTPDGRTSRQARDACLASGLWDRSAELLHLP
jgi:NAD(P)-dependent dehydrogenase (short-subunit alcohol dehydrogenase family)